MDTFSHGFWTYYVLRKRRLRWCAAIGGMAPDFAMFVYAGFLWMRGEFQLHKPWLPQLYSHQAMILSGSILHSAPNWLIVLLIGIVIEQSWLKWAAFGGFGHILVDLLTHRHFGDQYLWPYSHATVVSPIDYHSPLFITIDVTAICLAILFSLGKSWLSKQRLENIQRRYPDTMHPMHRLSFIRKATKRKS